MVARFIVRAAWFGQSREMQLALMGRNVWPCAFTATDLVGCVDAVRHTMITAALAACVTITDVAFSGY